MRYKLITLEQYEKLQKTDIKYAAFYKKDSEKYNVVYLESDTALIRSATEQSSKDMSR
ncbi:MAG: hypothetical protein RR540_00035 [Oscillospiraceae bacterium]